MADQKQSRQLRQQAVLVTAVSWWKSLFNPANLSGVSPSFRDANLEDLAITLREDNDNAETINGAAHRTKRSSMIRTCQIPVASNSRKV